ncbi:MAG: hypothetical protein LBC70_09885 [Chitinispirillales bacterium]|jgi:hypothetical protein|nr:hypothetical protein [Chitinispirillales bacterium]
MLKFKKLFLLGLSTVAIGLLASSCVEDTDRTYGVVVSSPATSGVSGGGNYKDGDQVSVSTPATVNGRAFSHWTSTPSVNFTDDENRSTTFKMPAFHVAVRAVYEPVPTYAVIVSSNGKDAEGDGNYSQGDTVDIFAGTAPTGQGFKWWVTSSPGVKFNDADSDETFFVMPDNPVAVRAVFADLFPDGETEVRFTWRTADHPYLFAISVSEDDVNNWIETVWNVDYDTLDATDIPLYDGSPLLPNNMYSMSIHGAGAGRNPVPPEHKGVYLPIDAGFYTAICEVMDARQSSAWYFDIVANYHIKADPGTIFAPGTDKFFEIAFDVGAFIDGDDDWGWDEYDYDDPNTSPTLVKRRVRTVTRQIVNESGTVDVTFHVLRRPVR